MEKTCLEKIKKKTGRCFIPLSLLKKRKEENEHGHHSKMCLVRKNSCSKHACKASLSLNDLPQIYDQGDIGSCTANAFCFNLKYLNNSSFEPSRLFFYFKERLVENSYNEDVTDSGGIVTDGCSYVQQFGICQEALWPYDTSQVNVPPPAACDTDALNHKIGMFFTISLDDHLQSTIAYCISQNFPVLMAFGVYQSFMSIGSDGMCPMPHPSVSYENYDDPSDPLLGGHEVCIVGYDDDKQLFTVANSWGSSWGASGFFYMPYAYTMNSQLVYDFNVMFNPVAINCSKKQKCAASKSKN